MSLTFRWNMLKARMLHGYWAWRELRNTMPCGCHWQYPYGFVVMADCPEHD